MLERLRKWYRSLPEKKAYFELVAAVLTIPVLVTVILLNVTNLNKKKENPTPPPPTNGSSTITFVPIGTTEKPQPTSSPVCKKEIGPVNIASPQEGEVVSSDPVCIDVSYTTGEYCSVVWSVRVNEGAWSNFSDQDVCLYNMTNGQKKVEVRVRSAQSSQEIILQRNFEYVGQAAPTSSASDSAH